MARAATSPELAYYRTPGKWSKLYTAILQPPIIYRARVNQTFSTLDQVISLTFDGGSGTLANVLPDMEVWIGTAVDTHDKGICRLRDKDATHFYISETSEIEFADNDYVTIVASFGLWARPVRITSGGTVYMDETTYTNQHVNWDPMPNMGPHKVAELTGASVNVGFTAVDSFCPGSSISTYAWSCATASASAGTSTSTCTLQFNTTGWHIVYLTLTAANGKTFFGVRYVYIWNSENPPFLTEITDPGYVDVENGGWEIGLTIKSGATLDDIYDRAMVILFSKDYYGDDQVSIGPVAGAENIRFIGWISDENNIVTSEAGSVSFTAKGGAYWMGIIPSWPDGVEFQNPATAWTNVGSLTVDLGVYHFLRWRTTATRVMDVYLTGDTRLTQQVSSSAQNIWAQLQEMTWAQIYARPGVNALNQLYIQIHPSLIPTGDRVAPTVMTLTKEDYHDELDFTRSIIPEVGIVDMSGVIVTSPGVGTSKFALSPGHSLPHYGSWDLQPNLLLSSQEQVITLAGLYRSWRNNQFKNIPVKLSASIALIDCFPNQKCVLNIAEDENVRGISFSGGVFPTSIRLVYDASNGYLYNEINFEAETYESSAMIGDTPGSGSTDGPPTPSIPDFPPLPPILPGTPIPSGNGPSVVVLHDASQGFIYSSNFESGSPTWQSFNAGLTATQYQLADRFISTPSGACYCGYVGGTFTDSSGTGFIARAPTVGGIWTVIYSSANLSSGGGRWGILGMGHNPTVSDSVGAIIENANDGESVKFYTLSGGSGVAGGAVVSPGFLFGIGVSYGFGKWMVTYYDNIKLSTNGASWSAAPASASGVGFTHVRAGSTGYTFLPRTGTDLCIGTNNAGTLTNVDLAYVVIFDEGFPQLQPYFSADLTGQYCMCRWNGKGKSTDFGYSWSALTDLPVGPWWFEFAGPGETLPRFIAAGGTSVRYSPNMQDWYNKEGNITSVIPIPNINLVKAVTY